MIDPETLTQIKDYVRAKVAYYKEQELELPKRIEWMRLLLEEIERLKK